MTASRRRFSQEFKDELCQEVIATSKPIREVAEAYGVGPETLRNWLIKYRDAHGGTETELTVTERARLKELERENQELRAETAFLKKPRPTSRGNRGSGQVRVHRFPPKRPDGDDPGVEDVPVVGGVNLGVLRLAQAPAVSYCRAPGSTGCTGPALLHGL